MTGSLTMRAPGGMTIDGAPPNVSGFALPAVMSPAPELRAIWAAPMVRGSRPNSLVKTKRTEGPPMEMWTISRRVVPSVPGAPNLAPGFLAAMGDVAQVPTHRSVDVAAAARFGFKVQTVSRESRIRGLFPEFLVMTVCTSIGSTFILRLFRRGKGVDV